MKPSSATSICVKDVTEKFGDAYRRYRERVSMIVPLPPKKG